MKRILCLLLVFLLIFSLVGCGQKAAQDQSPITMFVGLGNNQAYYEALQQLIQEKLGIEVQMIYQAAIDTTSALRLEFKNNDLPADIVCTASLTNPEWAANGALDLVANTHLVDYFTYQKIDEYMNSDGTIYQLPFTSKLIGITYNQTLMEENGWEVPQTYEDMLALKQECDEKGILFAVSANAATGHGFNYLFHLMGADWVSTLDGTQWFENFLAGTEDATAFQEQAEYFDRWVTNGLFGSIHSQDWASSAEFCSHRALFFFDLTSSIYSYEGEMVDAQGNPTGVMLQDEYKSMPWISEDGSNNCYTFYDNMFLALNKKLGEEGQEDRLAKAVEILEFMTTQEVTDLYTANNLDGYVAVNSFEIDETRNYYKFKDSVETGYTMPWYYTRFDESTIVNTGEVINTYLRGNGGSLDLIVDTLETNNQNHLNNETEVLTTFTQDLTYEETAKLNAIGAVTALQEEYDAKGLQETVSGALIAYVNSVEDYRPFTTVGAVTLRAYAGEMETVFLSTLIPAKAQTVMGVRLTGSRLKELAKAGVEDQGRIYPYVLLTDQEIKDDETYVIALSSASLSEEVLTEITDGGAILTENGETITAQIKTGLQQFLQQHPTLSPEDLTLD